MILSLRKRHRCMVTGLGIFLPIAFVTGIAARKPVPAMNSLPPGLVPAAVGYESQEWQRTDLFAKSTIQVTLLRDRAKMGRFAVELSVTRDFVKPDLLVYWAARGSGVTDTLPDNAILLGVLSPTVALPLPANTAPAGGVLVLYSLADQQVIEMSKPFSVASQGQVPRGADLVNLGNPQNFSIPNK